MDASSPIFLLIVAAAVPAPLSAASPLRQTASLVPEAWSAVSAPQHHYSGLGLSSKGGLALDQYHRELIKAFLMPSSSSLGLGLEPVPVEEEGNATLI